MEFIKFGNLNPQKRQRKKWVNAPANRGVWAFPYPYHRYGEHSNDGDFFPASSILRSSYDGDWVEYKEGYQKKGYLIYVEELDKLLPDMSQAKKFKFDGMLYTHLTKSGDIPYRKEFFMIKGEKKSLDLFDAFYWDFVEASEFKKRLQKYYAKIKTAKLMLHKHMVENPDYYEKWPREDYYPAKFAFMEKLRCGGVRDYAAHTLKDFVPAYPAEVFIAEKI